MEFTRRESAFFGLNGHNRGELYTEAQYEILNVNLLLVPVLPDHRSFPSQRWIKK